jgi:hypothetical protein
MSHIIGINYWSGTEIEWFDNCEQLAYILYKVLNIDMLNFDSVNLDNLIKTQICKIRGFIDIYSSHIENNNSLIYLLGLLLFISKINKTEITELKTIKLFGLDIKWFDNWLEMNKINIYNYYMLLLNNYNMQNLKNIEL